MAEETPAERRRREAKQMRDIADQLREKKKDERLEATQRQLDAEAAFARTEHDFADFLSSEIGGSLQEVRDGLDMSNEEDAKFHREVMDKLAKAQRNNDTTKAKKIVKANKGKMKEAAKKGKRGCVVVAIMIVSVIGAAAAGGVWGAVEVISAFM